MTNPKLCVVYINACLEQLMTLVGAGGGGGGGGGGGVHDTRMQLFNDLRPKFGERWPVWRLPTQRLPWCRPHQKPQPGQQSTKCPGERLLAPFWCRQLQHHRLHGQISKGCCHRRIGPSVLTRLRRSMHYRLRNPWIVAMACKKRCM